jgi:hypothetical protein
MGEDKIDVEYDVGTNTATLPTVNALFHSIVSTSHLATIDIVDYYLGAILPSPERIDVSSISLPTLTKLGLLSFLRHSYGKPFLVFCDVLKTVPGFPRGTYPSSALSPSSPNTATLKPPPPCFSATTPTPPPFTLTVDDFLIHYSHPSKLGHLVSGLLVRVAG